MIGLLFFILATISLIVGFVLFLLGLLTKSSVLKIIAYIAFGGTLFCVFVGIASYQFLSNLEASRFVGVYQLEDKDAKLIIRDDHTFFMDSVPGLKVSGSGTWSIDEILRYEIEPADLVFDTGESLYCDIYRGSDNRTYILFSYDDEFGIQEHIQDTSLVKEMKFNEVRN